MSTKQSISRRDFLATSGAMLAGSAFIHPLSEIQAAVAPSTRPAAKLKVAMVGTGDRGTTMWGQPLVQNYPDTIEFVGLCDPNPGRVQVAKEIIGTNCRTYSDLNNPMAAFEKMVTETKPDLVIVTTVDAYHCDYIVRSMELGANALTEKPMVINETQIQRVLDTERKTGRKTRVGHNGRYGPMNSKLWEILRSGEIGEITSVDHNYFLDISHGADYFRRWHRLIEKSGSLLLHKASHHFDRLNYLIDSDPVSVYAEGALVHYGKNGPFRAENCRRCPHSRDCKFYFQLEKNNLYRQLYIDCEKHDGYLRDGCVFRNDINIFDKTAATIKYANGVLVAYSLTCFAPYESSTITVNGTKGRIEVWPHRARPGENRSPGSEIVLFKNFSQREFIPVERLSGVHGGSDDILRDQIFKPGTPDPYKQCAGTRDGAMSCLIGIAARNSIFSGQPVKIADLTSLKPQAQKEYQRDILNMNV